MVSQIGIDVRFFIALIRFGNGMEDLQVHDDGEKIHEMALQMGINVIYWFLNP